jgi:hypothetical protein
LILRIGARRELVSPAILPASAAELCT